ncbi:copper resistance CopC family protein [Virgibacillus sp. DJP39]|uniref:copper resistance CopC family protein n=1 Tax=Virgibacillus sp. DJP39 TaxID=3409790 RepID=UPI003BB61411
MKRKYSLFLIIFSLFFISIHVVSVEAHSSLINASPGEDAVLDNPTNEIELSFNTKIENGSTLFLTTDTSEKVEPASIQINDTMLLATFSQDLSPGTYTVNWEVLGADGHIIQNNYSFTVKGSEESVQPESKQDKQAASKSTEIETNTSSSEKPTTLIYGIISLFAIAGIALLAWVWFGRNKK